jgi:hypothetical protein
VDVTTIDLELGIIDGDQKRRLECYVDSRFFRQRKSYDEYYVDVDYVSFELSIDDLMILAEQFTVTVTANSVALS